MLESKKRTWAHNALLILAIVLHAGVGFVYLVSGLVAPLWGVLLLVALWLGLSMVLVQGLRRGDPWRALLVPITGAALWFVVVRGLGTLFDWTA
jgi:hypothetical protein